MHHIFRWIAMHRLVQMEASGHSKEDTAEPGVFSIEEH
jgi:hypothetical protein